LGTYLDTPERKNAQPVSQSGVSARYPDERATWQFYMNITQIRERITKITERIDPPDKITIIYHPIIEPVTGKVSTVLKRTIGTPGHVEISEAEMNEEQRAA
jgi:hypothetical protein